MTTRDDLQRLQMLRAVSTQDGVLSVYLPVDPHVVTQRGYVTQLMDILKPLREDKSNPGHARIENEAELVLEYVRNHPPDGTAFIAFSSQAAGIWETFSLNLPIEARARWGTRPHLLPVWELLDDHPTGVLALVDQKDARLYVLRLGEFGRERRVVGHASGRQRQGGWSAFRYERDRQRHIDEHFEDVAEQLAEVAVAEAATFVVIAGTDENTRAVAAKLPPPVLSKLAGTFRAEMFAADSDLAEGAGRVIEAAEREQERRLARQVVDETLAGGRGALGLQDTLRMLRESRVHELVISENVLHTAEGEAAASMAEDSGIDIEVIHDEAEEALSPHGGIGAVLRY